MRIVLHFVSTINPVFDRQLDFVYVHLYIYVTGVKPYFYAKITIINKITLQYLCSSFFRPRLIRYSKFDFRLH